MKREWLIQFVGNALLIFLFYEWLGIRDSRISQIILSFVLGIGIFTGVVFLHSRTFHQEPGRFAVVLVLFLLIWWGLSLIPVGKCGQWIASILTLKTRKPISPAFVSKYLDDMRWFVQWLLVPSLLLRMKSVRILFLFTLLTLVGFATPGVLISWTPKFESTAAQIVSFVLRFGFAYCLLTTCCAAFMRFTSPGTPAVSQPKTAAFP